MNPKYYQRACQELCRRFPVELVDFEELFLNALRQVVDKAGAKWDAVVSADATPGDGKWDQVHGPGETRDAARRGTAQLRRRNRCS